MMNAVIGCYDVLVIGAGYAIPQSIMVRDSFGVPDSELKLLMSCRVSKL